MSNFIYFSVQGINSDRNYRIFEKLEVNKHIYIYIYTCTLMDFNEALGENER